MHEFTELVTKLKQNEEARKYLDSLNRWQWPVSGWGWDDITFNKIHSLLHVERLSLVKGISEYVTEKMKET